MNDDLLLEIIKEQRERLTDLSKSYRTLNDSHVQQQLEFVELKTEVHTVVKIVKWLIPPSMVINAVVLLWKAAEFFGLIK